MNDKRMIPISLVEMLLQQQADKIALLEAALKAREC